MSDSCPVERRKIHPERVNEQFTLKSYGTMNRIRHALPKRTAVMSAMKNQNLGNKREKNGTDLASFELDTMKNYNRCLAANYNCT
jgi:hypothetical protein